ncbi:alpha/beta hydrolase, PF05990 family [Leptospira interrogans serovar Grippotyphosa str. 2006006986]|uniref:alpha/beta hydrolase n=2 Tax=Leptospira interrogans TaxID=173 RepID=UPI00029274CC|nr:alpha/beta hydrolase [Leptospira interrogans]EKO88538.1 alpha/beta hydrolase, PF05990 family [Leptospira interrogans serovar Grippotyphosa str. Andaman]EKP84130.1 alpha/beta hydrolase, PF05990 family [Leptospira interrogans serovar Grippotyphosa str. 2006006986]
MKILRLLLSFLIFTSHCKTPTIEELLEKRLIKTYDQAETLNLYYATLRSQDPNAENGCNDSRFLTTADKEIKTGYCIVNVPANRDIGALQLGFGNRENFFQFLGHKPFANQENLIEDLKKDPHDEILVFVHGFNVKFEEAILRGGQIRFDLKFPGKMIIFTWPAGNEEVGLVSQVLLNQILLKKTYEKNLSSAKASKKEFKSFINYLQNAGKKIHLIVHSMGHQVVLPALSEIGKETDKPLIQELILNAPDFDSAEFRLISDSLIKSSKRITLYCSPGDNALQISASLNQGSRLGSCAPIEGFDVVNVNPVDSSLISIGHGYYSSRPLLTDIYQILLGVKAEKRLFIRKSSGNENYVLRN